MEGRHAADVSQVFFDLDFFTFNPATAQFFTQSRSHTTHKKHTQPDTEMFNLTIFLNA